MKYSLVAKCMNGKLYGEDGEFQCLSSDTRTLSSGDTYIALVGEKFDGHDFIEDAIEKRAACLVVRTGTTLPSYQGSVIEVSDTTISLGLFASAWRQQFDIPVIGITGSCGKTTVKSMIGSILSLAGQTLVTQGTLNNQFGMPFTLLKIRPEHQFAVIEIGTNNCGEIAYLAKLLQPTVSMITNVRPVHLEGLGSVAGVAKEKSDIFRYLRKEGTAIINADEPFAIEWQSNLKPSQKSISFGAGQADVTAKNIELGFDCIQFKLCFESQDSIVRLNLSGEHNVHNALCAAATCFGLDIPIETIVKGLEQFEDVNGRLKKHHLNANVTVIDDSYNANPASFKAAIEVLARAPGPKFLAMGQMAELGKDEVRYHQELGKIAKEQGIDQVFAYGELSQHTVEAFGDGATLYPEKQALAKALSEKLIKGSTILVKGSRSTKMEDVVNQLIN